MSMLTLSVTFSSKNNSNIPNNLRPVYTRL